MQSGEGQSGEGQTGEARPTIGLTGGIASGKSTVADRLAEWGAVVIDADRVARDVVAPGTEGWHEVVARFGPSVVAPDGSLDRPALGRIVFGDESARRDLEAIIHPRVRETSRRLVAEAPADTVVVEMIPLLVETGQAERFDMLIVVDLPEDVQRERLVRRSGLTPDEADARIAAQASRSARLAVATHVLDNSGDRDELLAQVDRLWADCLARS